MANAATPKPPTKTEVYASIAETTGLSKKEVGAVFEALNDEIAKALGKKVPKPSPFTVFARLLSNENRPCRHVRA